MLTTPEVRPPRHPSQPKRHGLDDHLLAHLAAGYKESVDEAMGEELPSPGDFPEDLKVKPRRTDMRAMELANLMVAAEAGAITSRDAVNLPQHYARFKIEPIRFIGENGLGFLVGNVIKYILRWDAKDGIQDLYKAKRYLEMMIAFVEKDPDWWKLPPKEVTA